MTIISPALSGRLFSDRATVAVAIATSAFTAVVFLWLCRSIRKRADTFDERDRGRGGKEGPPPPASSSCCSAHEQLREHTHIFAKRVIRVADDVLVATGYGLSNSICIRGNGGLIIIDTCESRAAAEECLRDFRAQPGFGRDDLKVAGVIYTHFHQDHVGGTGAFLREAKSSSTEDVDDDGDGCECEIWAHHSTEGMIRQFNIVMGPIAYVRSARQFGNLLTKPMLENSGIGPFLRLDDDGPGKKVDVVLPNRTYGDEDANDANGGKGKREGARRTIEIAGVTLELIHAPGETDDQTVVYMPSRRMLFAADNYYEAFPNLYAIRGVPYRDPMKWVRSLDLMRSLEADVMVPSHTLPVFGREEVAERLRNYRDAIAHVHDQTVRFALKGHHPDRIANEVKLPGTVRGLEYLKEFYGTVRWSCKSVFHGYLGWFSGEPSELFQLSPSERSARMVRLGGGPERCLAVARESMLDGDLQWALELVTAVSQLHGDLSWSVRREATALRVDVLRKLGTGQISANARNYYLTTALEAEGSLDTSLPRALLEEATMTTAIEDILDAMRYRIDADAAEGREWQLRINYLDSGKSFVLVLRNSVMTVVPVSSSSSEEDGESEEESVAVLLLRMDGNSPQPSPAITMIEVSCTELAWRKFLLSPIKSLLVGNMTLTKGSLADFRAFGSCFDRSM